MPDMDHDFDELIQRSTDVEVPSVVAERLHRRLAEFRARVEQRQPSRLRALADSLLHPASYRVPVLTAALLTIAVIMAILPKGPKAGRVYAAAATQLRSAHSLAFTVELAPYTEIDFASMPPSYRRVKCSWGMETRSDGSGRQIILMHLSKQYLFGKEEHSDTSDLLKDLKSLPQAPDQFIGEQWVNGRKLLGYRVHESPSGSAITGPGTTDLWVDAASGNPDHVDISIQEPGKPLYQMHIKNIRVDDEMNASLFDMTPPAGYTKIGDPEAAQQTTLLGVPKSGLWPEIKHAEALTAIVFPMKGSYSQSRFAVDAVQKELAKIGVAPVGRAFGRFDSEQHWVAGFPVPSGSRVEPPFELLTEPGTTVASVVVTGPWGQEFDSSWGHDSGSRWASFVMWIVKQGYQPVGPAMEFWSGDEAHPQAQTTEMRIKVTKAK
jgi:hypothetical protein